MCQKKNLFAYFLLIIATLLWAGNFIVGKMAYTAIPPFTLAFYRWLLVIIILFPICGHNIVENFKKIKTNILSLVMLSLLGIVTNASFVYMGLAFTTVINTSFIYASVPVLIIAFSYLLLGERILLYKMFGIVLSIVGVGAILLKGNIQTLYSIHYQVGDLFILMAALSWAMFSVIYKKVDLNIPPFLFLLIVAIIGDVLLLPCMLLESCTGHYAHYSIFTFASVLYTALFSSVLAITFWNIALAMIGPSMAAHFFNLISIFGAALSILFLGERLQTYHLFGGGLILLGILFATMNIRVR